MAAAAAGLHAWFRRCILPRRPKWPQACEASGGAGELQLRGGGVLVCGACGKATPKGFEPLRAEPNGFLVHLLSHSDKVSSCCRAWFAITGARGLSPLCCRQPPAPEATAPRAHHANCYFLRAEAIWQTCSHMHGELVWPNG